MDDGKDAPTDGRACIEPAVLVAPPGGKLIDPGLASEHHPAEAQSLALVARIRAGDKAAETRLLAALEPMAMNAARAGLRRRRKLPPWIDLDDILSAAREGLWMAILEFDGRGSFLGYAKQRAAWRIRQVIDTRTVRRSAQEVRGETLPDFGVTAVYRPACDPEPDAASERLKVALKPLNRKQRSLVESVNGLNGRPKRSITDIAAALGTSPQGAGKLYAGALRRAAAAGAA